MMLKTGVEKSSGLMDKVRESARQLRYLPHALTLLRQAAGGWAALWIGLLIAQGLLPAVQVWLTRTLVDNLARALGSNMEWTRIQPVLGPAALMAGLMLLGECLRGLTSYVRAAQAELLRDHIAMLIQRQSVAADYGFYENADFYDHLHRARDEATHRPITLIDSLGSLLQNGLTLLAIMVTLMPYGWWLPLSLVIGTAPALLVVMRYTLRQHEWRQRVTQDRRRAWYFYKTLTTADTAAEVRLFELGAYFQTAYEQLTTRLRHEFLRMAAGQSLAEFGAAAIALAITGATLAWTGWRAFHGTVTLGVLALFYQAFSQGQQLMRSLLTNIGHIYANSLFLGNLFEFLELRPSIVDLPDPVPAPTLLREGIRFHDVTFAYGDARRPALRNFDLAIPAGAVAAIVGLNGAGKTTLIKLLCRLYDPDSGFITMDGVDLRRMPVAGLRRAITVLFQHPVHYNATVAENIQLGDVAAAPDAERIAAAARAAGASQMIERLPAGYDTRLGKWFAEGTELSGGEWQRLALARAFLRQAPVMLLDEPTSAMDSWAEADWVHRFRTLAAGRTVIIITHRFTTAMRADIIHVMSEGGIIESGAHEDLLARNGPYANSWREQMQDIGG
ncbi:MAG: ABC transporter ATP-binding protein [Blastocatellia bacterium]